MPVAPAAPPQVQVITVPLAELSAVAAAWVSRHPRTPPEVVKQLLEAAALGNWRAARGISAPWVLAFGSFISIRLMLDPAAQLGAGELLEAYRLELAGTKTTWPGDRRVQRAAKHLVLALWGKGCRADLSSPQGSIRGWRGLRFRPPSPPPASPEIAVSRNDGVAA